MVTYDKIGRLKTEKKVKTGFEWPIYRCIQSRILFEKWGSNNKQQR